MGTTGSEWFPGSRVSGSGGSGIRHFERLYQEPERANLAKILKVISFFPRMVNEEDNEVLFSPITKEELNNVLYSFKKERSMSPNDWSVKFFIDFFKLLGTDLLRVVEEIRTTSQFLGHLNAPFLALIP